MDRPKEQLDLSGPYPRIVPVEEAIVPPPHHLAPPPKEGWKHRLFVGFQVMLQLIQTIFSYHKLF